jgi:hypothetical protein
MSSRLKTWILARDSSQVSTAIGETCVPFDVVPAPMWYADANPINVVCAAGHHDLKACGDV